MKADNSSPIRFPADISLIEFVKVCLNLLLLELATSILILAIKVI